MKRKLRAGRRKARGPRARVPARLGRTVVGVLARARRVRAANDPDA